ncbi:50 kDa spicule matrix protein-like [Gopherus flavomarginatus]|uniref:50 kDa spicule matrix protein-like n=1 Tax=Gopherus flavomarginatus TaxID=286002 RepID=UPI0021CC1B4C|nr:50 kDa spicule matrix protein-like [Gopherus flavomarginatus]
MGRGAGFVSGRGLLKVGLGFAKAHNIHGDPPPNILSPPGLLGSLPGSGRGVGAGGSEQGGRAGCLGSLPGSGRGVGAGGLEQGGLGARTPGFSPWLWEGSQGWWVRAGGAGSQDSWVLSLALGEEWGLVGQSSGGQEPGLLGSLPGSGRGVGAGGQDSWVLSLALGEEWGLVGQSSGGQEPGLLGSLPGSGRGVGAGGQDSWVLSLALGEEWGLVGQSSGGQEPGLLGSLPGSGRGVGYALDPPSVCKVGLPPISILRGDWDIQGALPHSWAQQAPLPKLHPVLPPCVPVGVGGVSLPPLGLGTVWGRKRFQTPPPITRVSVSYGN